MSIEIDLPAGKTFRISVPYLPGRRNYAWERTIASPVRNVTLVTVGRVPMEKLDQFGSGSTFGLSTYRSCPLGVTHSICSTK